MAACSSRVGVLGFKPSPLLARACGRVEEYELPKNLDASSPPSLFAFPSLSSEDNGEGSTGRGASAGISVYKISPVSAARLPGMTEGSH
jgi:hypothetical protein